MSKEEVPNVLEAIQQRRSIRRYLDLPIEFEKVGHVLDAGRMAPSAGNLQDWKFILVMDPAKRLEVAEACLQQYWVAQAPVLIVVVSEPNKSERYYGKRGEEIYSKLNAGACIQNMLLAAHGVGLGACWVSAFVDEQIEKVLEIDDEDLHVMGVVVMGYPDEKPQMPLKFQLHDKVFFNTWDNRSKDESEVFANYSKQVKKALEITKKWAEDALKKIRTVK